MPTISLPPLLDPMRPRARWAPSKSSDLNLTQSVVGSIDLFATSDCCGSVSGSAARELKEMYCVWSLFSAARNPWGMSATYGKRLLKTKKREVRGEAKAVMPRVAKAFWISCTFTSRDARKA